MEEDTLTAQIPSNFYALLAVFIVAMFLIGGLINVDLEVSEAQKSEYRQAAILENVMALDANSTELQNSGIDPYNYSERRGYIPIEYFSNGLAEGETGIGHRALRPPDRDFHCYLPEVAALDGENFAYRILVMDESADASELPDYCIKNKRGIYSRYAGSVFSQALLVRKNLDKPPLPVRIYVYTVE